MGGRDYCCIVGCNNRRSNVKIPFHKIPKKPEHRRKSWIYAAGRRFHGKDKFTVTDYTRVCGAHFVFGCKSNDPLHVDYVPTTNLPVPSVTPGRPKPRETSTSAKARTYSEAVETGLKTKPLKYCSRKKLVMSEIDINDVQSETEISVHTTVEGTHDVVDTNHDKITMMNVCDDHSYAKIGYPHCSENTTTSVQTDPEELGCCMFTAVPVQDKCTQMTETVSCEKGVQIDSFNSQTGNNLRDIELKNKTKVISALKDKVSVLTKERNEARSKIFSVENMLCTADKVQFYTGLPNKETFTALFEYLKPKAENLTFWRGKLTKQTNNSGKANINRLSLENQLFATLVRLRLGSSVEDLSDRFNVSVGYFSGMFNTWVRFLRLELEDLFIYPSAEQVRQNTPDSFHKFPNTRLIIDCTEIFVQKPSALKAQRETWSNYKHRNTHKILVGITPDGTVAYVSSLYGGAASDKFITKDCGLLNLIQPGDNIMADRGFEIGADLNKLGAGLNIPPFRNGNYQLTSEQVEQTRRIAEVRIHVERAIQRIKSFLILNSTMPATLQMVAEDIFKTCSYLTNFQTPILKA